MESRLGLFLILAAGLVPACDSGSGESSTSSADTEDTALPETDGENTEGETEGEPDPADTDPADTDPADTDPADTDPADTDTDPGDTDSSDTEGEDTDGDGILAECDAPDPAVDSSYSLVGENWDDLATAGLPFAWYDVEESCRVVSVEAVDSQWVTELDCGGEPARFATLSIAAPANGTPSWSADETLILDAFANADEFGGAERIQLRRGEDVLVHILRGSGLDANEEGLVESLGATPSYDECDAPALDDYDASVIGKLGLRFEHGDTSTVIISGHRGSVPVEGGTLEVDVAEATSGNCCHSSLWIDVLMRVASPS